MSFVRMIRFPLFVLCHTATRWLVNFWAVAILCFCISALVYRHSTSLNRVIGTVQILCFGIKRGAHILLYKKWWKIGWKMNRGNSNQQWQQEQARQSSNLQHSIQTLTELAPEALQKQRKLNELLVKSAQKKAAIAQQVLCISMVKNRWVWLLFTYEIFLWTRERGRSN